MFRKGQGTDQSWHGFEHPLVVTENRSQGRRDLPQGNVNPGFETGSEIRNVNPGLETGSEINVTDHQRNANQNHIEIPSHAS